MIYVKAEDLKVGMRLARPIYNKRGILLYGRNDKITRQGIESVKNFGLIGLYVLEPAEPLAPMSVEEMQFERFQTMEVFRMQATNDLLKQFGNLYHKINFNQNLRSPEDYVYKHALNVAILSALISHRAGFSLMEQSEVVVAAFLHDLGKLNLQPGLRGKPENLTDEARGQVARAVILGIDKISNAFNLPAGVKGTLMQLCQVQYLPENAPKDVSNIVKILVVANAYDEYTAMQIGMDPHTEVDAVRMLQSRPDLYDPDMVNHLMNSIKILYPGVCVELTNHEKGLVLGENDRDILRPVVLGFDRNQLYNLGLDSVFEQVQIKNIMKTMDNRIKIDPQRLEEYM